MLFVVENLLDTVKLEFKRFLLAWDFGYHKFYH